MKEIVAFIGYVLGIVAGLNWMYKEGVALFKDRFTWKEVDKGVRNIVGAMRRENYCPDIVVGIGRSGGIIGGLIAGHLGGKPFRLWDCHYNKLKKGGYNIAFDRRVPIASDDSYDKVLLVEGATKSGTTPRQALDRMQKKFSKKEFRFAVLVKQVGANAEIDYYAKEVKVLDMKKLPWHIHAPEWPDPSTP